jgi:hypothetical protein
VPNTVYKIIRLDTRAAVKSFPADAVGLEHAKRELKELNQAARAYVFGIVHAVK